MKKTENKGKLPFGTKGIKRTMVALIALTMTTTLFISVIGTANVESSMGVTVYGTVEDEFGVPANWFLVGYENLNANTGEVSEFTDGRYYLEIENVSIGNTISLNFTDGKCFVHKEITVDTLPMEKELNITLDPMREKPKPAHFERPDIEGIKEAMGPLNDNIHLPERPEMPVIPPVSSGNESNETNETAPPIILQDIRCPPYFRLAFTEKKNRLQVTLKNVDTVRYVVKADLYEINPDGVRTFLKTIHYGNINPDDTKAKHIWWIPETAGKNWIYGEIYIKEKHGCNWTLINTFKEDFNTVPGWRPVMEIDGDWVIDEPTEISNRTIIVSGDVYVNAPLTFTGEGALIAGNFTVSDATSIPSGWDVDLQASYNGEFKAEIKSTGVLILYGKIHNTPSDVYYNFYMNGSLTVERDPNNPLAEPGSISEVNGNPNDLSQPGGIICMNANGSVEIKNGGRINNTRSHGLYLYNTAAELDGAVISNCSGAGVYIKDTPKNVTIKNTEFRDDYVGAYLQDARNAYGRPDFIGGEDKGYFIWYDEAGWHLVYSSDSETHVFTGTITIDGVSTSFNDTLLGGQYVEKHLGYYDNITFDLLIDGKRDTGLIYIGRFSAHPDSIPFTVSRYEALSSVTAENCNTGIAAENSSLSVRESTVDSNIYGIYAFEGSSVYVKDTSITGNGATGAFPGGPYSISSFSQQGGGMYIEDSEARVTGSVFSQDFSISIDNVTGTLENNAIILPFGVAPEAVTPVSGGGIMISNSHDILLRENLIFGGGGSYTPGGIGIRSSYGIQIINNTVASTGIYSFEFRNNTYTFIRTNYTLIIKENGEEIYNYTDSSILMGNCLYIGDSHDISVEGNYFNSSLYGNTVEDSSVSFINNTALNHSTSAFSLSSSDVRFAGNTISTKNNEDGIGILSSDSIVNISKNNEISLNYIGVYLKNSGGIVGYAEDPESSSTAGALPVPPNANYIYENMYGVYLYNSTASVMNNHMGVNGDPNHHIGVGIRIESCNIQQIRVENNVGDPSWICIYVNNSTALVDGNYFSLYGKTTELGTDVPCTGIEGVNSQMEISSNQLYGLQPGTDYPYIGAGIKLMGCYNTTVDGNRIMTSSIFGPEGWPMQIGIYANNTSARVENNAIGGWSQIDNIYGIIVVNGSSIESSNNSIVKLRYMGIYVENSSYASINDTIASIGSSEDSYGVVSINSLVSLDSGKISTIKHIGIYGIESSLNMGNESIISINGTAVYSEGSSLMMSDGCNISETYGYGLYAVNSTADIENSTFYHQLNWSIWLSHSKEMVKIANNLIDNSTHGIYYGESDVEAEITGNTVSNHSYIEWTTQYLDSTPIFIGTPVGYGIYINNSIANISKDNRFINNAYALYFYNSTGSVGGNNFEKSLWNIVFPEAYTTSVPSGGQYITMEYSWNISITDNGLSEAYRGISARFSANLSVEHNSMGDIDTEAAFKDISSLDFYDNSLKGSGSVNWTLGLSLENTEGTITYNHISDFRYGIRTGAVDVELGHNIIEYNRYGIFMEGKVSGTSMIHHNQISKNTYGIYLSSSSYVEQGIGGIHNNNIEENTEYGAYNANSNYVVDMSYNWWGSSDGPAPYGSGNPVSEYIDASNPLSGPVTV